MATNNIKISLGGKTDPGRQRSNNEDAFVAQSVWDEAHVLAVVIDGVGGYEGGEVATSIAKQSIIDYLEKYPNGERLDLLKQAVVFANNAIVAERKERENLANMSCVLTAILIEIEKWQFSMVHVGDTRLYQYHRDELTKLSHDHSLVGYREEVGDLTEDQAMHHPQRNIINRDVGSAHHEIGDIDFLESAVFPLLPNSTLLLCSDGLTDMITSEQIKQILRTSVTVEEKATSLIEAANTVGGKDNITVVLLEYLSDEPETIQEIIYAPDQEEQVAENRNETKKRKSPMRTILLSVIALLAGAVLGWLSHEKCGLPVKTPSVVAPVMYDSLKVSVLDSLVIVNGADTLLMKHNKPSFDINGVWVKRNGDE